MIGQSIGLPSLVPLALDILEQNPLAEGECRPTSKVVRGES